MTRRRATVAAGAGVVAASLLTALPPVAAVTGSEPTASPATSEPSASPATPEPTPTAATSPSPTPSPSLTAAPSPSPSASESASASAASDDRFIVVTDDAASAQEAKDRAVALGADIAQSLVGTVDGFAATLDAFQISALEGMAGVEYIEPDRIITLDAPGSAVRLNGGCSANSLGRVDDASSGAVTIGFPVNWFGTQYASLYVNNNGGVALNDGRGGFSNYTGIDLSTTTRPLILPLFTDMDTRNLATSAVTYGQVTDLDGNADVDAFCVNWVNVGEYNATAPRFSAQLVIVDQGSGNVDLEFNYNTVGTPTSSSNGRFVVGYADPNNRSNSWVHVSAADATAPYVDNGASALNAQLDSGSAVDGRFVRQVRPGASPTASPTPSATPTPTSTSSCTTSTPPGTYGCAPWGLDRLDTRTRTYDQLYTPAGTGTNVVAYIVDTGVRQTHNEFAGRMGAYQYDAVDNDTSPQDCHGHGTHVAGTVAGTNYGVARQATVAGVRVLDCYGSGYTSDVVAGLNWIAANHAANYPGRRAVVNMSLGGGADKTLDDAVEGVISAGIPVVVAAGNDNANAQVYSPARVANAITVAASDSSDVRAWFSNYGTIIDLFAPGVSVLSAGIASDTSTATYSGTSMASPHVAGAAAVYLGLNPTATTSAVASALGSAATTDVVTDPAGSVNRLLYVRAFDAYTPPTSGGGLTGGGGSGGSGSSGGGSSGGGSSGGGSSGDSGGGGSLQEIKEVRPAFGPVSGGNLVAIIGYGFTGATSVTVGGKATSFRVVNDATVEVTMPAASAPGSADIAVNLTEARGRAFAPGGYVYQPNAPEMSVSTASTTTTTPTTTTAATSRPVTAPPASLAFRSNSAALPTGMKRTLSALVRELGTTGVRGTVVAYGYSKGPTSSATIAKARARNVTAYLRSLGVSGRVSTKITMSTSTARSNQVVVTLTRAR